MGIFDGWKKDKATPDFTNVRSGASSTAPAPEPQTDGDPSPEGSADTRKYYVVVKGDTLSSIARRQYGDTRKWGPIFEANRDRIKDADLIYPGQQLRIP